ncbi:MAG TPA: sialate O-acetylesterase [Fibrobacter sp.]|nr:sialate O-acetylesterase [Fibrobacter sp.]
MNKFYAVVIFLLAVGFSNAAAEWSVFLLIGQSNMAGQGPIESMDKATDNRVKVLAFRSCNNLGRTDNQWYTAAPPLHDCNEGVGPGDWFAKTLLEKGYTDTIALVPVSISGSSIDLFVKGSYYNMQSYQYNPPLAVGNYPSRDAYPWVLDRLKTALKKGKLKGVLLHQGESDTGSQTWVTRVAKIMKDLKTDLSLNEDVPFLAGELPYNGCCGSHNSIIAQIPGKVPNSAVVSANGLTGMIDQYHFNTAAYRELGKRYAQEFLKLSPILPPSSSSAVLPSSSSAVLPSSSSVIPNSSSSTTSLLQEMPAPSLKFSVDDYSLVIENAVKGSSYFVSDLQGNKISQGVVTSEKLILKQSNVGVYILKMGQTTRKFSIK